jgi:hypothetical protein
LKAENLPQGLNLILAISKLYEINIYFCYRKKSSNTCPLKKAISITFLCLLLYNMFSTGLVLLCFKKTIQEASPIPKMMGG